MVWALFPADPLSGDDKYFIFKKGTYKVGRKGCDVIISKDKGVSRVHADIIVDKMMSLDDSINQSSGVRIRDCSKYGTFINRNLESGSKVHEFPNKETGLKDGDMVSFGTGNAIYRFSFVPLVFFAYCSESFQANDTLQHKVSSIGAHITCQLNAECTHVLVDDQMPVEKDVIDAVVSKKPIVIYSWIELLAERTICSEIPSWSSHIPSLTVEGVPVKVVDSVTRANCLRGYTCLLESINMYKFGDRFLAMLEVAGANIVFIEEFSSSSQGLDYKENFQVVCVIPHASTDKFGRFSKLTSLSRVHEVDLLCAIISGHFDSSKLMLRTVVVSSSCSTDETMVADSDEEVETTFATANICCEAPVETSPLQKKVETSPVLRKVGKSLVGLEDTHIVSSMENDVRMTAREKVDEPDSSNSDIKIVHLEDTHIVSSTENNIRMTTRREKVDEPESSSSDIIYSQDLIIRDWHLPAAISSATNGVLDFKRFKKKNFQSGNSFDNLIPFSKYPYKDSDYEKQEMHADSVKEEKKRKQMEAIAEDLFNNEKGRRRGVAGSLRSILSHS